MTLGIFMPGKVGEFAKELAQGVARRYPPAIANNPDQIVSQKRIAEILDQTFASAHQFLVENRLGIIGRVKLGNTFKRELREFGYEEKFVELAAERLIGRLVGRSPGETS